MRVSRVARAALAAGGAVLLLAACGGGSQSAPKAQPSATSTPASQPAAAPNLTNDQQMQNTIREYNQASLKGDGATACSKMTPTAQQQAKQFAGHQYSSC